MSTQSAVSVPAVAVSPRRRRQAALAVGLATLLGLAVLFHHPDAGGAGTGRALLARLSAVALRDEQVHGTMIALLAVMGGGLTVIAVVPGLRRVPAWVAVAAWWLGWLGMTAAALLDGFVAPQLAVHFTGAAPAQIDMATMALALCGVAIQVLTRAALQAMAGAMLAWACALWPAARGWALAGLLLGLVTAGVVLGLDGWLGPATLPAVFGLLATWNIVAVFVLCGVGGAVVSMAHPGAQPA